MRDQIYINGQWRDGRGHELVNYDPATGDVFHRMAGASPDDVNDAVGAARRAFSAWGNTKGHERAVILDAIADRIDADIESLSALEVRDNGKPLPEARWDIEDTAGCFRYYAQQARELDDRQGSPVDLPSPDFGSRVYHEPLGPCGLITPWNYPMLMAAWKVAPALAAGCTCVLKPSEYTPLTALEMAHLSHQAGLPAGVLNVLPGHGHETGHALSHHPDLVKLAFTGSANTGRAVMTAATQDLKNVSLELGGKSPAIVFDDADVDSVVEWILFGIFWNQGEVCSATSRLLIQSGIADKVLDRLCEEAQRIPIGPGMKEGVLLGPLVSERQLDRVLGFVERARDAGVSVLTGGACAKSAGAGYFMEPTIFTDVPLDAEVWREEVFGPVLASRRFTGEEEAVVVANDSPYGLAAAVFSADEDRLDRVSRRLNVGIVWQNCSQPTFTEAPWGGTKASGIGRELGPWGLNNYLSVKQVTRYTSSHPWGWYLKEIEGNHE